MPNDARLGLVVGVTLVILVAIFFVRKNPGGTVPTGAVHSTSATNTALTGGIPTPISGLPGAATQTTSAMAIGSRTHTIKEDETLFSVAVRYYGDPAHVPFLYRANRQRILAPDRIPIGTVLIVPELPRELAGQVQR